MFLYPKPSAKGKVPPEWKERQEVSLGGCASSVLEGEHRALTMRNPLHIDSIVSLTYSDSDLMLQILKNMCDALNTAAVLKGTLLFY